MTGEVRKASRLKQRNPQEMDLFRGNWQTNQPGKKIRKHIQGQFAPIDIIGPRPKSHSQSSLLTPLAGLRGRIGKLASTTDELLSIRHSTFLGFQAYHYLHGCNIDSHLILSLCSRCELNVLFSDSLCPCIFDSGRNARTMESGSISNLLSAQKIQQGALGARKSMGGSPRLVPTLSFMYNIGQRRKRKEPQIAQRTYTNM
ncbi:hypothetical protein ACO22_01370 [Paracoccidioides brasiliensis]|uniref:Uncharacterized protein n=1 Tax=Paracoccidioides brasiliensis TaxID=121759 RepID=A0A1D2JLS1_PARBR|nr:hypothetical protein ACO22_01370 [Paracoccidioides brasiliensis]